MKLEQTVLGFPIRAQVTKLDEGWDVGVFGGCSTHVGAVTLAQPDGSRQTIERPGHRDSFVTDRWAAELAKQWNAPVSVRCGIHYDNATKAQIAQITAACETMLQTLRETGDMPPEQPETT